MRTIILGKTNETRKVLEVLIQGKENDIINYHKSKTSFVTFKNGDVINCLLPVENIRGHICNTLYVPSYMSIEDVELWETVLSHGHDIEVVVYRVNKNVSQKKSNQDANSGAFKEQIKTYYNHMKQLYDQEEQSINRACETLRKYNLDELKEKYKNYL